MTNAGVVLAALFWGMAIQGHAGLVASYPFSQGSLADSSGNGYTASVVGGHMAGVAVAGDG